jgi:hypothetical protein
MDQRQQRFLIRSRSREWMDSDMVGQIERGRVDPQRPAQPTPGPVPTLPKSRDQMEPRLNLMRGRAQRQVLDVLATTCQRLMNTSVTNVPGPQAPLYLAGAQLLELFPIWAAIWPSRRAALGSPSGSGTIIQLSWLPLACPDCSW